MAYFADLSPCDYFGPTEGRHLAVGWLDGDHPYSKGQVARPFFEALVRLLADPWQPFVLAGRHACELCRFSGGPAQLAVDGSEVSLGVTNLFVPTADALYVAPSMILHYIDAHEYAPPEIFQDAVRTCPPMRSMPYLKAMKTHGVHRLGKSGQSIPIAKG